MPAERMPPLEPSLMVRPVRWTTRLAIRFPKAVVAVAAGAAAVSLLLTAFGLSVHGGRADLLKPRGAQEGAWPADAGDLGGKRDAVVVVEGPGREPVVAAMREAADRLRRDEHLFQDVLDAVDFSRLGDKGLYYLPMSDLAAVEQFVDQAEPIARGQWTRLKLGEITAGLSAKAVADPASPPRQQAAAAAELGRLADGLRAALESQGAYRSPWPQLPKPAAAILGLEADYLLAHEGRTGFVLLRLASRDEDGPQPGSAAVEALRDLIAQTQERHPQVKLGLAGLPVMEDDEARASRWGFWCVGVASLVGAACLLLAVAGPLRYGGMAFAAVLLTLAAALGCVTLAIGHLNILGISLGAVLIGLGTGLAAHYVVQYVESRRQGRPMPQALEDASRSAGPGVAMGLVAAAAGFLCAGLAPSAGIAELGIVAGGGILLCLLGTVALLPALIAMCDAAAPPAGGSRADQPTLAVGGPGTRHSPRLLLVALGATAVLGLALGRLKPDYNLLHLQPAGLDSADLQQRQLAPSGRSVWHAWSSAASRQDLLALRDRLLEQPAVARVEEIATLLPGDAKARQPVVARIRDRLEDLPEAPPVLPVDRPEELSALFDRARERLAGPAWAARTCRALSEARLALDNLAPADRYARLADYQQAMAGDLLGRLREVRAMAGLKPPRFEDLPEALVARFLDGSGAPALKIFPREDPGDIRALEEFADEVRSVDPQADGSLLRVAEASRAVRRSHRLAAVLAVIAVLVMVYSYFRNARDAALALVPVVLAVVQTLGLMGLVGIPLDPATAIVLPLVLGLGAAAGIQLVRAVRCPEGECGGTAPAAWAVPAAALTVMLGFGALMLAGPFQALGRALVLGAGCCLFNARVVLPAMLAWARRRRPAAGTAGPLPRGSHGRPPIRRQPGAGALRP